MGGEKYDCTGQEFTNWGSPPRGRGKAASGSALAASGGITPAWAGKRNVNGLLKIALGDHPRMGGEKMVWPPCTTLTLGSPPHGRGKEFRVKTGFADDGITPA